MRCGGIEIKEVSIVRTWVVGVGCSNYENEMWANDSLDNSFAVEYFLLHVCSSTYVCSCI